MTRSTAILDVLAALPAVGKGEGLRPHEVHQRVGKWGRSTIRHALRALVDEGLAEFDGPDCGRVYRRSEAAQFVGEGELQ